MRVSFLISLFVFIISEIYSDAQTYGCTDRLAANFNRDANLNDGSCIYEPVTVSPISSFTLPDYLSETSGLTSWNGLIWTHNDNDDIQIYSLDTLNGNVVGSYEITGAENIDWEEISHDDEYFYIGDFGNNSDGNRQDLRILRIGKNSLLSDSPVTETIAFSYPDQADFSQAGPNNTDFDCEAFIVSADSIYLFTKQWISNKTSIYSLPKTPGTYVAKLLSTYDAGGLITGAVWLEQIKLIALCGYSSLLEPFILLLYDYTAPNFFGGNKRKISLSLPFHQVEGITTTNGLKYYISNESFIQSPFINTPQKLHILDLSPFLEHYPDNPAGVTVIEFPDYSIFPVPATEFITINDTGNILPSRYFLINQTGQVVSSGRLTKDSSTISISHLSAGLYILRIGMGNRNSVKVIKK